MKKKSTVELIWKDRKRHLRMPISFTRYSLSEDRLFLETGVLNLKEEEILLYRVRDITLMRSFGQRILGVGTVCVKSSDLSVPHLDLVNILHPKAVKELISNKVEEAKDKRRMRATEIIDSDDTDLNRNGIPDSQEHYCVSDGDEDDRWTDDAV